MEEVQPRRSALKAFGLSLAAAAVIGGREAEAATTASLVPEGAKDLRDLQARLARAPRRRDYKTSSMVLTDAKDWDHEALAELIAYKGKFKQIWDNVAIDGPWLNLMRNALNTQIWSFRHPDYLAVSGTHSLAHLALFDQAMWEKYSLPRLAGEKFKTNTLIIDHSDGVDPKDFEKPDGLYAPAETTIPVLQRRGVVFLACHNAIWEISERLIKMDINPDKLAHDAMCAELTNHLIPGCVLTPGVVGTALEMQLAGFQYAK